MYGLPRIVIALSRIGLALVLAYAPVASQPTDARYWASVAGPDLSSLTYTASHYGAPEASFQLGEFYWHQQQRSQALDYYRRAVNQGSADAAYRLATLIPSQQYRWLNKAATLGHHQAILSTVEATLRSDPVRAEQQLRTIAEALVVTPRAQAIEAPRESLMVPTQLRQELTWVLFNHPWLATHLRWTHLHPDTADWRKRVQLAAQLSAGNYSLATDSPCYFSFALLSSGGNARSTLYKWLDMLKAHPLGEVGLCFREYSTPISCQLNNALHLQCAGVATHTDARIEVVDMATVDGTTAASTSIARVSNSTMSISSNADFRVFIHELGHLLGLADEYAMSTPLAQAFCSGQYEFSPLNLVVTSTREMSWDALHALQKRLPWRDALQQPIARRQSTTDSGDELLVLGSEDESKFGLFATDTCEGTPYYAWRPVAAPTFMQQHELGNVPELYIRLIRQALREAHSKPLVDTAN